MSFQTLLYEVRDGIAVVTVNRPDKLNALNDAVIADLDDAVARIEADDAVKGVILTGAGPKAFVAGADLGELSTQTQFLGKARAMRGQAVFRRLERCGKPVVAAVNGFALGGGLELAMSCHVRVASDNARMGLPEVSLGVIPGYGGTQRLARLVGKGKAMEMIFTAGMIKADEALQWGLVNHVVPQADLLAKCIDLAAAIMKNSPTALAAAIRAVNAGFEPGANGMQREIEECGKCFGTADFKEGTSAFMEKRKANFTGV